MIYSVLSPLFFLAQEAPEEPKATFFEEYQGFIVFAAILILIALCIFFGKRLARAFRMPEYGQRLALILAAVVFSALIVGTNYQNTKFGVDLRGGINMIGSLNFEDAEPGAEKVTAATIIPNLLRRIDPSGTKEIVIRPLGDDKIEVIIPSVNEQEADEIWNRLVRAGLLQFRVVADRRVPLHQDVIDLATKQTQAGSNSRFVTKGEGEAEKRVGRWVGIAREDLGRPPSKNETVPFKYTPGPQHLVRDARSLRIIDMREIPLGNDPDFFGDNFAEWAKSQNIRTPQILMMEPEEERANVEGQHLSSIRQDIDEYGRSCVSFQLTNEGGRRMGFFTTTNVERELGIVLDGQLHSAPTIQEAIYESGRITGQFSNKEIEDLLISLRSGKLDVALNKRPISKQFIESSLGEELKQKGLYAIGISLIIVLIFMAVYYRFAGAVATFALILNLLLIFCFVMLIQQPLTLTGLAGLVLTVGMSVDANVLIFERIREEVERGSALRMAIRNGFDKATTTIVDANVTTLITALVLYIIGTEQIKGFAVTLILGILMSMFTAIYCSRAIFDIAERRRYLTNYNIMKILSTNKFEFLSKRMIAGAGSVVLIMIGVGSIFVLGSRILDHDLRGGSTARVVFESEQDVDELRQALADAGATFNDGEKAEFSVSLLRDDDLKNRVFKIDSSIPTWDEGGEPPYRELPEVLKDVFGDKLSNMKVEFEIENKVSAQLPPGANRELVISALKPTRSSIQEENQEETEATSGSEETAGNADQEATDTENTQEASQGGETTPADETTAPATPSNTVEKTKVKLSFEHPIAGKTIKTLLSEAARRADFVLDEEQIDVDTSEAGEDENPNNVMSTNWEVTMEMGNVDNVNSLLSSWQDTFNAKPYFPTSSGVGGQIAANTQLQALGAIIASLIGIIAYVWIRFQNIAFGLAAVIALIHDVLIVLGAIALTHFVGDALGFLKIETFKISLPIIAALLTIIGYSLNDTIVVFDRIREVRGKRAEITEDMINTSISQTLSRTILTSLTTFIVVFILFWFGGDAIHGFAFSLVIGVIVGTYSSIFVASPSLLWLMNTVGLNPGSVIDDGNSTSKAAT